MHCPKCQSYQTTVLDTRHTQKGTRRRRKCLECGERFTTYETLVSDKPKKQFIICGENEEVLAVISDKLFIEKKGISVVVAYDYSDCLSKHRKEHPHETPKETRPNR